MHLHAKIAQTFRWNTLEALTYQLMLFGHQVMLFKVMPPTSYGLVGTLFALTYFVAGFVSAGFEQAITPFFITASANRGAYKKFILDPFIEHMALATLFLLPVGVLLHNLPFLPQVQPYILLISLFAWVEGARKIVKSLAQLAFKARHSTYIELSLLCGYLIVVWSLYGYGYTLSMHLLLIPLLIILTVSLGIYSIIIYQWYCALPTETPKMLIEHKRLWYSRGMNFINQVTHLFFSSNFLIPWIAVQAGLEQAGMFKLLSQACYIITPFLQRTFGLQGQLLFAHLKNHSLSEKMAALTQLNKRFLILLNGLVFLLLINIKPLISLNTPGVISIPWLSLILFCVLLLSENVSIIYEKFCIAEERVHYLIIYALMSCAAFSWFTAAGMASSLTMILMGLLMIRLCSCAFFIMLIFGIHTTLWSILLSKTPSIQRKF